MIYDDTMQCICVCLSTGTSAGSFCSLFTLRCSPPTSVVSFRTLD